jgi:hypothetical protein
VLGTCHRFGRLACEEEIVRIKPTAPRGRFLLLLAAGVLAVGVLALPSTAAGAAPHFGLY